MTEREAERRRFELKGADPATEVEARTKGERLRRELDRERMGRFVNDASRPQFWWRRRQGMEPAETAYWATKV
jgi:hypothetical protein